MTMTEAVGIITRIGDYFPGWLSRMDEEEQQTTIELWAGELVSLGSFEEVWPKVLECLRKQSGAFPPGIFEIRRYVGLKIADSNREIFVALPRPEETEEARERRRSLVAKTVKDLSE